MILIQECHRGLTLNVMGQSEGEKEMFVVVVVEGEGGFWATFHPIASHFCFRLLLLLSHRKWVNINVGT